MYDVMEVGENKFLQRLKFWGLGGGFTVGIMNNKQMYRSIMYITYILPLGSVLYGTWCSNTMGVYLKAVVTTLL
jgi:hypothetical protein